MPSSYLNMFTYIVTLQCTYVVYMYVYVVHVKVYWVLLPAGVFLHGCASAGTVVCFYPGTVVSTDSEPTHACCCTMHSSPCAVLQQVELLVPFNSIVFPPFSHGQYLPTDLQDMPHFPDISRENPYLMSHSDGSVIDAKEYATEVCVFVHIFVV